MGRPRAIERRGRTSTGTSRDSIAYTAPHSASRTRGRYFPATIRPGKCQEVGLAPGTTTRTTDAATIKADDTIGDHLPTIRPIGNPPSRPPHIRHGDSQPTPGKADTAAGSEAKGTNCRETDHTNRSSDATTWPGRTRAGAHRGRAVLRASCLAALQAASRRIPLDLPVRSAGKAEQP